MQHPHGREGQSSALMTVQGSLSRGCWRQNWPLRLFLSPRLSLFQHTGAASPEGVAESGVEQISSYLLLVFHQQPGPAKLFSRPLSLAGSLTARTHRGRPSACLLCDVFIAQRRADFLAPRRTVNSRLCSLPATALQLSNAQPLSRHLCPFTQVRHGLFHIGCLFLG